jgi:WD40 repeat protein
MEGKIKTNVNVGDKLTNLKISCKTHNSDIGGVCDNFNCKSKTQLLCVKCVADNKNCIRAEKHNCIPINEFVDNFFNKEYHDLKTDYNTSTRINNVFHFLDNSKTVISEFRNKIEDINSIANSLYESLMKRVNDMFEDFNQNFIQIMSNKEKLLKDSILNLTNLTCYDYLCNYDPNLLKDKMSKMPINNIQSTVELMKKSINSLKSKEFTKAEEEIASLINVNQNTVKIFTDDFKNLEIEVEKTGNRLKSLIKDDLFKLSPENLSDVTGHINEEPFQGIQTLNQKYSFPIDYSYNSNFLDKKFTIFEHSNLSVFFAYPTSQHTIKIEYFDKFYEQYMSEASTNKTLHSQSQNVNARDTYLFFKLQSHGAKINELQYYRTNENHDLLISSSDDKSIKIWDITNLNKYITNVNEYYKQNCIKTLIGHDNRIICFKLLCDRLKDNINYLVSMGYGDKIKVWDLSSGKFIRDIQDSGNSFDDLMEFYLWQNTNFMITCNNNYYIRIWNFDTGKILQKINYQNSKIVSILPRLDVGYEFFLIDENSSSLLLSKNEENNEFQIKSMNLDAFKTSRTGAFLWNSKSIFIYCKNGCVYEYNLEERKFNSNFLRLGTSYTPITYGMKFHHHTEGDLLLLHQRDQTFKIYSI